MLRGTFGSRIALAILSTCMLISISSASESGFFRMLASIDPQSETFYNCSIEVSIELVDRFCVSECTTRVFARLSQEGAQDDLLLAGIINANEAAVGSPRSGEEFILLDPKFTLGVPRIAGVAWSGLDGRIMMLRLTVRSAEGPRYVWCKGVDTRRQGAGFER